ncbi:MAG: hypothetical protein LBR53_03135 [Deltaproteobacteria bacterium]|jgi:hypothetical protein|nr:hypothetical protein [Deltaproteobacteria bacterium]
MKKNHPAIFFEDAKGAVYRARVLDLPKVAFRKAKDLRAVFFMVEEAVKGSLQDEIEGDK